MADVLVVAGNAMLLRGGVKGRIKNRKIEDDKVVTPTPKHKKRSMLSAGESVYLTCMYREQYRVTSSQNLCVVQYY